MARREKDVMIRRFAESEVRRDIEEMKAHEDYKLSLQVRSVMYACLFSSFTLVGVHSLGRYTLVMAQPYVALPMTMDL